MFEMATYRCPDCGMEIREELTDGQAFECTSCRHPFRVMLDASTKHVGLVPLGRADLQEPLGLPRGSVRAISTLTTASCCWTLIFIGRPVPGYVLSLLMTTIGYYFGFRQRVKAAGSRIIDAAARPKEPLNLPGGSIRTLLIFGFAVTGVVLSARGQLTDPAYLEFFVILAGLVAGYFFARFFKATVSPGAMNFIGHAKGTLVIGATVVLAVVLLTGAYVGLPRIGLTLACLISFYFGSRS